MLSVVIPVRDEEENIEPVYERLSGALDATGDDWEIVFSVDPSTDRTEELIDALCARDSRVRMLRFSRRFGQPMAILAGMEASSGDAVIVIALEGELGSKLFGARGLGSQGDLRRRI